MGGVLISVLLSVFLNEIAVQSTNHGRKTGEKEGHWASHYEDRYEPPSKYYKLLDDGDNRTVIKIDTMIYGRGNRRPAGNPPTRIGNRKNNTSEAKKPSTKAKRYYRPPDDNWKPLVTSKTHRMDSRPIHSVDSRVSVQTDSAEFQTPCSFRYPWRENREYNKGRREDYKRRATSHYTHKLHEEPGRYYSKEDYENDHYSSEEYSDDSPERYYAHPETHGNHGSDEELKEEEPCGGSYRGRPSKTYDYSDEIGEEEAYPKSNSPRKSTLMSARTPQSTITESEENVGRSQTSGNKDNAQGKNASPVVYSSVQFSKLQPHTPSGVLPQATTATTALAEEKWEPSKCRTTKKKIPTPMNPDNEVTCFTCADSKSGHTFQQCSYRNGPSISPIKPGDSSHHRRKTRALRDSLPKYSYRFAPEDFASDVARLKLNPGEACEKVRRNSSVCLVCFNAANGTKYEQCSYANGLPVKTHETTEEESYKKIGYPSTSKGFFDPDIYKHHSNASLEEVYIRKSGLTSRKGDTLEGMSSFFSPSSKPRGHSWELGPAEGETRGEDNKSTVGEGLIPLYSSDRDKKVGINKKDKVSKLMPKNFKDYFYRLFPEISSLRPGSTARTPPLIDKTGSEPKGVVQENLSDCVKFTRGLTTCYRCSDEQLGVRREECFSVVKRD